MVKITYEDKIDYLADLRKRVKLLNESCKSCMPDEELARTTDIIECIMEDVRDFKMELWLKSVLEVYDDKRITKDNLRLRIKENISDPQGALKCIKEWVNNDK